MLGHDPQRGTYPEAWIRLYIPADRVGHYDVPGWTANGIEPWGLQMDPIGADGSLNYKGFFNLLLGLIDDCFLATSTHRAVRRPYAHTASGMNTTRMPTHQASACKMVEALGWLRSSPRTALTISETG